MKIRIKSLKSIRLKNVAITLLFVLPQLTILAQVNSKILLSSENYIERNGNLSNTAYRIKTQKNINIVFYGGSITYNPGWRDMVCTYLQQTYPSTKFTFLNAAIPSLGSLPHAFRLNQDVLDKGKVDLLFLESAVNDFANGTPVQTQNRALEGIIKHVLRDNPTAEVVMMAFVDPDKIKDYNAGITPSEVKVHQQLAKYYHFPFINLAKEVTDRINAKEFSWETDFKNLHPSPFGQEVYFRTIKQALSIELDKPLLKNLVPSFVPKQINTFAYTNGRYINVNKAVALKSFTLNPIWKPTDNVHTRAGFVDVPVLEATLPEASLTLEFTGQVIGLNVLSGPDAGKIKYSIDGKNYPTVDLYTKWSSNLHLPWYVLLADELKPGKHTLKIEIDTNQNQSSIGTACRIVHFLGN